MFFNSRSQHLQLDWRSLTQKMNVRKTLEEFIEIYRGEPCLWKVDSRHYRNRQKKSDAYRRLVDKLREIEPDANRAAVVRKINNLRTAYRKELKRMKSPKNKGEPYQPKLWYFDRFEFLNYEETQGSDYNPEDSESESLDNNSSNEPPGAADHHPYGDDTSNTTAGPSNLLLENIKTEVILPDDYDASKTSVAVPVAPPPPPLPVTVPSIVVLSAAKKPRIEPVCSNTTTTTAIAADHLYHQQQFASKSRDSPTQGVLATGEDRFDVFSKNVACKLRDMDKTQRILVEKIINDALFEGEMGTLTRNHKLVDVSQQYNAAFMPYAAV